MNHSGKIPYKTVSSDGVVSLNCGQVFWLARETSPYLQTLEDTYLLHKDDLHRNALQSLLGYSRQSPHVSKHTDINKLSSTS